MGGADDTRSDSVYGVPDWRDESSYKYIEKLSPVAQQWECVRRSSTYRFMWAKFGASRGGFSLKKLIDPSIRGDGLPEGFTFDWQMRGRVLDQNDITPSFVETFYEQGVVFVAVDLFKPVESQLEDAKKVLRKRRAALIAAKDDLHLRPYLVERVRKTSYLSKHLRAVDAHEAGASWEEIAFEVYGLKRKKSAAFDAETRVERFLKNLTRW